MTSYAQVKAWRKRQGTRLKGIRARWYRDSAEYYKEYRRRNRSRRLKYMRAWRKAHKDKRAYTGRYRERKLLGKLKRRWGPLLDIRLLYWALRKELGYGYKHSGTPCYAAGNH